MEVVRRGPPRHRALLDPVLQPAVLGRPEQRHEALLELDQVLVHRLRLVAPDEAAHRRDAEQRGGVHHRDHEVVLLASDRRVFVQHVVEVGDVCDRDTRRRDRRLDALGALSVEGLAQVERVGDRVEHRLGGHVCERGMQRRRQLDAVDVQLGGELQPLLDREVGIWVAALARRELLQCGGQHSDRHVHRFERSGVGHVCLLLTQ